jgi:hypothetical protein
MMWTPEHPSRELPRSIRKFFHREAYNIQDELEAGGVELVPAPEPKHACHMIRVSRNPDWYRDMYWSRDHFRRDRSLAALQRIRKSLDEPTLVRRIQNHYDTVYRALIQDRLLLGYDIGTGVIAPEPDVQHFFGIPPTKPEDFYAAMNRQPLNSVHQYFSS